MRKMLLLILFQACAISLHVMAEDSIQLGYELSQISRVTYEEGRVFGAQVVLDSIKRCYIFYYNGAMMATPIYSRQIKEIEKVDHSDLSPTGELYYGKSKDGTYFVEKEFHESQNGLSQGLIMFGIPEVCYEDVLIQIASLPYLPAELLR